MPSALAPDRSLARHKLGRQRLQLNCRDVKRPHTVPIEVPTAFDERFDQDSQRLAPRESPASPPGYLCSLGLRFCNSLYIGENTVGTSHISCAAFVLKPVALSSVPSHDGCRPHGRGSTYLVLLARLTL